MWRKNQERIMTEIENVFPMQAVQNKASTHITMWDHVNRLSNLQEVILPVEGTSTPSNDDECQSQQTDSTSTKSIGCELCGIKVTSHNVLNRHLQGRRHQMRVERQGKTFECELCSIAANSQSQLDTHLKSARHKNRVFRKEHGYDPSYKGAWIILFCVACIFLNFLLLFKLML